MQLKEREAAMLQAERRLKARQAQAQALGPSLPHATAAAAAAPPAAVAAAAAAVAQSACSGSRPTARWRTPSHRCHVGHSILLAT